MSYPLLNAFLTMMWFFLWLLWLLVVCWIILDVLRNRDLGGGGKAGWILVVILVPLIGVLIYLVMQGVGRHESAGERGP